MAINARSLLEEVCRKTRVFQGRYLVPILLIAIVLGIYKALQFSPLEQELIGKVKVNDRVTLYITEASAGATTDFSYRFYLGDASQDDKTFMASLEDGDQPFMITTDKEALKKVEDGAIYLSVKGTIFTYHSPALYRREGVIYSVPIYLTSSPF